MRKKGKIILSIVIFLLIIFTNITYGNQYIKENFEEGIVTAELLNIRQGPDENQSIIEKLPKNTSVKIISKIDDWYIVQTESKKVGCALAEYIQKNTMSELGTETQNGLTQMTEMETKILNMINEKRKENNLVELTIDDELQNVARLKAQEMVEKEYFSHTSPEYGSPFEMMSKMGISYKVAGENIAGNISEEEAVKAWMSSEGHKDNILDNGYNFTGIGIAKSPKYGNVFVQMFIGR